MARTWIALAGAGAAVLLLIVSLTSTANGFNAKANAVDAQWHQVETEYQRRLDLIPNLVAVTQGAQQQEIVVFGKIAEANAAAYRAAPTTDAKVGAANQLDATFTRFFALVQAYPELKSNQAILRLQDEVAGTENRIAVERRRYNDQVRDYNTAITNIPGSLIAGMSGRTTKPYFEAAANADTAPKINFGTPTIVPTPTR